MLWNNWFKFKSLEAVIIYENVKIVQHLNKAQKEKKIKQNDFDITISDWTKALKQCQYYHKHQTSLYFSYVCSACVYVSILSVFFYYFGFSDIFYRYYIFVIAKKVSAYIKLSIIFKFMVAFKLFIFAFMAFFIISFTLSFYLPLLLLFYWLLSISYIFLFDAS